MKICALATMAYIIGWGIVFPNYFLLSHALDNIIYGLLILSLFKRTKKVSLDFNIIPYLLLVLVIGFLGVQNAHRYDLASIKSLLDLKIIIVCALLYFVFNLELIGGLKYFFTLVVVLLFTVVFPVTLIESFDTIVRYGRWLEPEYGLTGMFKLTYFRHIRHFSYIAFIACAFSYILLSLYGQDMVAKVVFGVFLTISIFGLLLSYGRGAILAFALFILIFELANTDVKKAVFKLLVFLCCTGLFYVVCWHTELKPISQHVFGQLIAEKGSGAFNIVNQLSTGRLELWRFAFALSLESPVYGHGVGSAVWMFSGTGHGWAAQPHNAPIQWMLDFGLIGFFLISIVLFKVYGPFVLALFMEIVKRKQTLSSEHRALTAFLMAYFIFSLTDGLFYHSQPMMIFFLASVFLYLGGGKATAEH